MQKMLKVAATIDGDGDGKVDAEEIATAYQQIYNEPCDPARAQALLESMDRDGNGSVSVEEFEYYSLRGIEAKARSDQLTDTLPQQRARLQPCHRDGPVAV